MNETHLYKAIDQTLHFDRNGNSGLFDGALGWVAFYSELSRISNDDKYAGKAADLLGEIFDGLSTGSLHALGYGHGMQGLSTVYLQLLETDYFKARLDLDTLLEMDNMAISAFDALLAQDSFGFQNGAAGCLYYLLQRTKTDAGILPVLESMVLKLKAAATVDESGLRFTPGDLHLGFGDGAFAAHYNLSLKDGLTGILLVCVRIYESWGDIAGLAQMIERGLEFYLQLERAVSLENHRFCFFPTVVSSVENHRMKKREFYNSRLGWCIGDLPTAWLFVVAGTVMKRIDWMDKGNMVAEFTLQRRDMAATKVDNPYFCHGAAGIAMMYKRLYQLSGNARFMVDGYNYWIKDVFKALKDVEEQNFSLLNGSLGILWTALNCLSAEESTAEKLLLL